MKAFFSKRRRYAILGGLLHFTVPRPYQADAWGPQVNVSLLLLWLSMSIGRPGESSDLRITWPWRSEALFTLRYAGRYVLPRWGMHYGDLWLGRLVVRAIAPRYVFGSLMRLLTHGAR